jgi:uncharacterized membrane protein YdbT with pleckstrin-like domain
MATDFSQPQRQSPIGVLVMFADTARHFVRAFLPLAVLYLFNSKKINPAFGIYGLVGLLVLIAVGAYLSWRNFTFYLDDGNEEFIISEGVFNKTRTVIALDKIQQVNITQSLIQRINSVYGLEIDTAGSQSEEGKIRAVSHHLALALKSRLLDNEKKCVVSKESTQARPIADERPFMQISLLSLIKVGITSNYIKTFWLIFVFIVTLYDNLRHLFEGNIIDSEQIDRYVGNEIPTNALAVMFGVIVILILVINLVRTVVRYFGYQISRQRGSLMLSFGLINTKSTIIKPEKVQIVTVTRNYFQKKMNILGIRIKQATSGQEEMKDQHIDIPGCDERERDALLNLLYGIVPEKGAMLKPNYRKLVFSIFLSIVLPLSVFFLIASQAAQLLYEYAFIAWVYAALVLLVLVFGFRNYRLFVGDRFIIRQSGAWDVSNEIVEPAKIQAITTSQLFWHKGVDIGYLTLHTAGGNISFALGDFTKIKAYVNLWLYEMESTDVNWM